MKQINDQSQEFRRKRKLMLMAPLVFLPMLCLAFYGLGGGNGSTGAPSAGGMKGLNMTLPLAHFDNRNQPQDKDGFYEKAKQDSMRLQERKKQDPYVAGNAVLPAVAADEALAKLDQLKQLLGKKTPDFEADSGLAGPKSIQGRMGEVEPSAEKADSRAAALLEKVRRGSASPGDPEMERLDGMLDKLIRIQHPELVRGDTGRTPGAAVAAVVSMPRQDVPVSTLSSALGESEGREGFMEIGVLDNGDSARELAIEAIINSDQTLTAGSTVALRIVQDFTVGSEHIRANQLVYGLASLAGERLMVNVSSIRVGQSIVPVSMQVYDLDGLPGIRVPGALTRDASKESADQALSGLQMASVDPSVGAQAASAGLEFAKSLASRKIRLVRVSLPAGYRVLLKNSKSLTR